MVDGKLLNVSASPHVRSTDTTPRIMLDVIIALIPALAASVYVFGPRTLLVTLVSVACAVLAEYITRKIFKRSVTVGDLSAVVTGLLLAYNLPVTIPLWIAGLGSVIAIVVVKQFFGGIGQNFANPAIAARIILLLSFGTQMTDWVAPLTWKTEAVTTATPLAVINAGESFEAVSGLPSLVDMFFGVRSGVLGETCAVAIIIGGIYLIARKVIAPTIPLTYIGTVAVIMLIKGHGDLSFVAYEVMGGGLLLGAIFMATDYSTSPINTKGKIIFGVGCGIITALIRLFASMTEGVSFAILIMNFLVPYIEKATIPKPFGSVKESKKEAVEK